MPDESNNTGFQTSQGGDVQASIYYHNDSKYEGDLIDLTATKLRSKYECLNYADPVEFLFTYDDALNLPVDQGGYELYKWQVEIHHNLTKEKPTAAKPHRFALVAANGAGKDRFIAAPFAVWFILCKIQSLVIITTSSGTQLTAQTEPAIRALCEAVNRFHGEEIFRIRQRYIKCRLTGSEIRMFATDEAGKAEGYHPLVPGAEMAILVNESKSVKEEIHGALRRCSGFNYWIEYSSPGEPIGFFYDAACNWKHTRKVTSFECPHISGDTIEEDKRTLGEHSALFRSMHLAEFTSVSGQVVVPLELLNKILLSPPPLLGEGWPTRIGIDIAAGGDENSICKVSGNRVVEQVHFKDIDTTITADRIEHELIRMKVSKDHEHIYADDGGVGHAVIDMLVRRGWKVKRIMNQWPAISKRQFGNRGAENWYRVARILEEGLFDVSTLDEKTKKQLVTRRYKTAATGGRIFLESKREAKANGRPSPDRADAFILSLTGITVDDFLNAKSPDEVKRKDDGEKQFNSSDMLKEYYDENITYGIFNGIEVSATRGSKRCHNSLEQAMKN